MGFFSVVNNISSLIAQQESTVNGLGLQKTLARLSSGLRLRSGGDDAAGLAIADGLRGQVRTLQQSVRNVNDGIGFLQTADSSLGQVQNILTRAASLLSEAATDTNAGQFAAINNELSQLFQELDRIGGGTEFNGIQVFAAASRDVFVGDTQNSTGPNSTISFTTSLLTTSLLGVTQNVSNAGAAINVALGSGGDAQTALGQLESAIDTIAQRRGTLGAKINRLETSVNVIQAQIQNLTSAESQIRDANIAEEIANLTKFQILTQSGIAALAQANQTSQSVLALFR